MNVYKITIEKQGGQSISRNYDLDKIIEADGFMGKEIEDMHNQLKDNKVIF